MREPQESAAFQYKMCSSTSILAPPDWGNSGVCLDIEMSIATAPWLSKVIVYEAPNSSPWEDILIGMANDNAAKQLSCPSGGGSPDITAEHIF